MRRRPKTCCSVPGPAPALPPGRRAAVPHHRAAGCGSGWPRGWRRPACGHRRAHVRRPGPARDGSMSLMVACPTPCTSAIAAARNPEQQGVPRRRRPATAPDQAGEQPAGRHQPGGRRRSAGAGQRLGLDLGRTLDVIEQSSGQSWIGSDRLRRAIAGDYAPRAHVSLLHKDTRLALEAARAAGLRGPAGPSAPRQVFAEACRPACATSTTRRCSSCWPASAAAQRIPAPLAAGGNPRPTMADDLPRTHHRAPGHGPRAPARTLRPRREPFGLTQALAEIRAHKVDDADLYFQYTRSEGWSLEEGIVKTGSFSIDQGVGVRAVSGEKTAFAYSDDISEASLLDAARTVRTIAPPAARRQGEDAFAARGRQPLALQGRWTRSPRWTARPRSNCWKKSRSWPRQGPARRAGDGRPGQRIRRGDGGARRRHAGRRRAAAGAPVVTVIAEQNGRREVGSGGGGGRFGLAYFTTRSCRATSTTPSRRR
jgi:hypothetical protein